MAKFKLKAGQGSDEANFKGVSYRPDASGEIEVPAEAVATLVGVGGFTLVDGPVEAPEGCVFMKHGDPSACMGEQVADANGLFTVPLGAASGLVDHGFVYVEAGAAEVVALPAAAAPKLKIPK